MTVTWSPRLHMHDQNGKLRGVITLPDVTSAVLPRIGEVWGIDESRVWQAIGQGVQTSDGPKVHDIRHHYKNGETDIWVQIRVIMGHNEEKTAAGARALGFEWAKWTK